MEVATFMGRLGPHTGAKGGKRRAASLTPAERKASATKASKAAAAARTKKKHSKKPQGD